MIIWSLAVSLGETKPAVEKYKQEIGFLVEVQILALQSRDKNPNFSESCKGSARRIPEGGIAGQVHTQGETFNSKEEFFLMICV